MSFNTQPPEGGWFQLLHQGTHITVSTHSRPKAAGCSSARNMQPVRCFNTQPPEGGWGGCVTIFVGVVSSFNTQPPEGGWRYR